MIAATRKSFDVSAITIRPCEEDDMRAVAEIYGHHVLHSTATFELDPPSLEEMMRRRRVIVEGGFVYLVAEADSGVVGYAYAGAYHGRPGYRFTVENSVYVREGCKGAGVGTRLMQTLLAECEKRPCRQMIAVIGDSANHASIDLHSRLGFRTIGTLRSVGFKFGRWLDTVMAQKELGAGDHAPPAEVP
jgi:L-amino acid N-acyltransferase YncA